MGSRKMVLMNLSLGQQWTYRHREQTCGHREGEGGTNWRTNIERYTLRYVEYSASRNLLYDSGISNLVLCVHLDGWDRVGGEREIKEGGNLCIPMADSCWCMAETDNTIEQLSSK